MDIDLRKKRGFAHIFARNVLQDFHYQLDRCRIEYSQAHAGNFVYSNLLRGYGKSQIGGAYYYTLLDLHSDAVDNEQSEIVPAKLVSEASDRLLKFKPENPDFYGK